uniref:Uncharacterized protein n=1 Tax=Tanacetum cinerariifolium TaxID=118510 RepID=A0A699GSN7_TANCI|nr:hypothetical protein [Tanacetum cinerariifolium]
MEDMLPLGEETKEEILLKASNDEPQPYSDVGKKDDKGVCLNYETVYEERGDRVERDANTTASLDAEQDNGTINRTQSTAISNEPIPQRTGSGGSPRHQDTILGDRTTQTRRYGHDTKINTASTSITTASINITIVEPVTTVSAPITTTGVSVSTAKPKSAVWRELQGNKVTVWKLFFHVEYILKPKRKVTEVPQPSEPTEYVTDEAVYKELGDRLVRATTNASSLEAKQDIGNIDKTQSKATPNEAGSPGTTSGGGLRCQEAMGIPLLKLDRVDSFKDKPSLGEDASKNGRKINDIDADEDITLMNAQDDAEMFDVTDLHGEEVVFVDNDDANKEVNDASEVNAASIVITVSATSTITTEEVTLAKALAELKTSKPKVKRVFIQEPSESITTTSTKTISSKKSQDKGKGIMVDEPVKPKKKEQIRLDEEATLKLQAELQAEFEEEQRLAREKA